MRLEAFNYEVEGKVVVTKAELQNMIRCAETHYDATCRSTAIPGPRAFLNGMRNSMRSPGSDAHVDFETAAESDTSTDWLTTRQLDLLLKILESPAALPELYWKVHEVYKAVVAEGGRVNAVAIGENRLKADELLGVRCGVCGQEFSGPGPSGESCAVTLIRHRISEHVRRSDRG